MQTQALFAQSSIEINFESFLKDYCVRLGYDNLNLTREEIDQLSWYLGSANHTPQASEQEVSDKWHVEIKRSLARCHCFNLLLDGSCEAFKKFIAAQNEPVLEENDFKALSKEAKALPDAVKEVIRASCFLSINEKIKNAVTEAGLQLSASSANDNEKFLSHLAVFLQERPQLLPLTSVLTSEQIEMLRKVYWPDTHFRHLLYTEGGDNMTQSLYAGLSTGQFSVDDFALWKWRWLTNLFGFIHDRGAKYYNKEVHLLASAVFDSLLKQTEFVSSYLAMRADLAGLTKYSLPQVEVEFIAHLAAYFNQLNIITPEQGALVYQGYAAFKEAAHDQGNLAKAYQAHCKDSQSLTPTHLPAILNNAFLILKESLSVEDAMKHAIHFTCDCLIKVYDYPHNQYLSFREFSQQTSLRNVLPVWLENRDNFQLYLQETGEMMVKPVFSLTNKLIRL